MDAIMQRKSIRRYSERSVDEELVLQITKVAEEAPSAGGLRSYTYTVTHQQLTPYPCPISVVVCALPERSARRYGNRGRNLYSVQDATIFAAYLQLLAVNVGLSTVWVGAFRESRIRKALELEKDVRPVAIINVGYRG